MRIQYSCIKLVFVALAICIVMAAAYSQTLPLLKNAKEYPFLSTDINKVAKMKISIRKTRYFKGEILVIDYAVLQSGDQQTYFPSLKDIEISVKDKRGKELLFPYVIYDSKNELKLFEQNQIETGFILILVGCQLEPFQLQEALSVASPTDVYEKQLFTSWGSGCIKVNAKSTLELQARLMNRRVLVDNSGIRTAVGELVSSSLMFKVY